MKSLFDSDIITYDQLVGFDFESFKENGCVLDADNLETIMKYYCVLYDGEKVPFYHCLPLLNSVVNSREYRYLLIDVDNDTCFIAYKVIQILTTKQIRCFDIPISSSSCVDHTFAIIKALSDKSFVRFAVQKSFLCYYNGMDFEPLESYNNYFYSYAAFSKLPNRKFKDWRVKSLTCNDDFSFCITDRLPLQEVKNLRNSFNRYLLERGSKPSPKDDKEFFKLTTTPCKGKKIMPIYYKGLLISVTVFMVFQNVVYNLYQIELKHYDNTNSVLDKMLRFNMEEKTKYIAFMLLNGIERIYILGAMPNEKRLIAHKERTSDGKIEYFITK